MSDETRARVLITAENLKGLIEGPDCVVIDIGGSVGGDGSARTDGIPGAIAASLQADFAGPGGGIAGQRPLPSIGALEDRVRRWGISRQTDVVVYDDSGGLQAARAWWVLRWAGLGKVRLLDGGLSAWRKLYGVAPLALQHCKASTIDLTPGNLPTVEADDAAERAQSGRLLDAREISAFEGVDGKGGHIPGAHNVPAKGNLDAEGHFLPSQALKERYSAFSSEGLAVSCGSGVSAAHDIAALASIGIPAALYVASWSGWTADPSRPVARREII